jgi:integrase
MVQNFCKGIKRPRLPEKLPVFYTRDEFQKLVDGAQSQDLKDIFIFAVNTGLRQMELLRLEWNQIDFVNSLLYLDNRNFMTK